jgi:hypothetical protein
VHQPDRFMTPQQIPPVAVMTQVNPNITVQANANSQADGVSAFVAGLVVGMALAFAIEEAKERRNDR